MIEYYPVKFRKPGPPVDRAAIAECERQLAVTFPQPYVDFLLEHNGGSPSPAYLPLSGECLEVKRIYSIGDDGLLENSQRLRTTHALPTEFVPFALLGGRESYLLLDCSAPGTGAILIWSSLQHGFRYQNEEYSNAGPLYFRIDELFYKFGPAKNRKDRDGMFFRLYYSSGDPANGGRLATKFVAEGYDINYVIPTFQHPIIGAINWEAFGVAATLLSLGTRLDHVDAMHDNATIEQLLHAERERWTGLLEITRGNKYQTGIGIAMRHLADIEAALEIISSRTA